MKMNSIPMKIKMLMAAAVVPMYKTDGSAAMDFAIPRNSSPIVISSGENATIGLGMKVEVEKNFYLQMFSRSGHGQKQIRLANSVGVIDSDYRGELMVTVHNDSPREIILYAGDRIAQGIVLPAIPVEVIVLGDDEELSETERGEGGHGSTGIDSASTPVLDTTPGDFPSDIKVDADGEVTGFGGVLSADTAAPPADTTAAADATATKGKGKGGKNA